MLVLWPNEAFILCCLMIHLQQCGGCVVYNPLIIVCAQTEMLMDVVNVKFKTEVTKRVS